MPKRVGSSEVSWMSSMDRRGRRPLRFKARMASSPPITPTVPSYMPAWGMASMCEPVATAGRSGSVPAQRKKLLPTASSRIAKAFGGGDGFEPGAGAQVVGREDNAGDGGAFGGGLDGGEGGERVEFVEQAGCIDLNVYLSLHVGHLPRRWTKNLALPDGRPARAAVTS